MTVSLSLGRAGLAVFLGASVAACDGMRDERERRLEQAGSPAAVALPADARPAPPLPARFGSIGRRATDAELAVWDIDVNPAGTGLPPGRGTYAEGAALYAVQCAVCHGRNGEGIPPYPRLVGREPREGFPFAQDFHYPKTIGNYWPYATTVYDYVHRAMPLTAPGSLKPNEVYSLVAYLLAENEVIPRTVVVDARSLPTIQMPARNRFVRDDRRGGAEFR